MSKSTVYFTNELTPEAVVKMYKQLGVELPGKVAVKVHSGEDGNQNYLHPEFMKPVIDAVHGTVVECNTAYGGARNETPKHIELMKKHHWSDLFDVDIMDAEGPDVEWPVENGKVLKAWAAMASGPWNAWANSSITGCFEAFTKMASLKNSPYNMGPIAR